jgi:hypothetical protein
VNKALLAALNDSERLLVAETEPPMLALLDEDEASALHTRVLRARNKAQGIYRRGAAGKVSATGGRGKARPQNSLARTKVEAFEEALARVSQRLAVLARQSARELRDERLAAAKAAKAGATASGEKAPARAKGRTVAAKRTGDRSLRSPVSEKKRAGNQGANARWQSKRDAR